MQALTSLSHTLLSDSDMWTHMFFLLMLGAFSCLFVILTQECDNIGQTNNPITSRISLLISFILSSYIAIVVNRWDRIRNVTLCEYKNIYSIL